MFLSLHPERLCTSKEITEHFKISINHMVKVTHNLSKIGLIKTQKGKNGGIKLSKTPEDINLGSVIRQLEPDFNIVECFCCKRNKCRITIVCKLKSVLFDAYKAFINKLDKHTLADVTENKGELLEILRHY